MPLGNDTVARMNHLEVVLKEQNRLLKVLAVNFAWYYRTPQRKVLALIQKLNKDKANLVAFSDDWSGGVNLVEGSPIYIPDPDLTDDEQQRDGKWEPILMLGEVLSNFGKEEAPEQSANESPEEVETATAIAENPLKGKLAPARK